MTAPTVDRRTAGEYQTVGHSVARVDGKNKVTGAATYSTDFYLKGMLHAKILFADRPYARIVNIDVSKALALPGVQAVVTGDDAPDRRYGGYIKDKVILAKGEVKFIGEHVAAVAAISERIAAEAIRLIKVTYEDRVPLLSTDAALAPDAPQLHPDVAEYEAGFPYVRYGNVCMETKLARGDVDEAFAESDVVVEETYKTGAINHAAIEPHACVAGFDPRGRLTVWTATQQLSVCHTILAEALDLPMTQIKVVPLEFGGGFGGKLMANLEPLCALLAQKTGQAVRLAMTREEEFFAARARAPFSIRIKLGAKHDGTLTAGEVDIVADAGAYSDHVTGTATHALSSSEGVYRFPAMRARSRAVYTNNPDYGCMRGYGTIQAVFALETHMDVLARRLDMDPAELRLKNLIEDGDQLISTSRVHDVHIRDTMQRALEESRYWDKKGGLEPNRGIGMANMVKTVGLLASSAQVRLNGDGTIGITTAAVDIGTGTHTVLTQIAAETLGVPFDSVGVGAPDSDSTSYDEGSIASRTVFDNGSAVRVASENLRAQIAQRAADTLDCDVDDIIVDQQRAFRKNDPDAGLSLAEIAGTSLFGFGGPLVGTGSWFAYRHHDTPTGGGLAEGEYPSYGFGTHVAEVEIDPDTGQVQVIGYTACHDVGRAINPMALEGQIEGGIAQGLGGCLFEEMIVEDGRIQNPNFVDYHIPTILDAPIINASIIEIPDAKGPFGAKGIGEHPILGPGPAIANAIADAAGVAITEIPITPERLFNAMNMPEPQV